MKYYYITGTGKGIGKAIAEQLLMQPNTKVIGISRTNTIEHNNFTFIKLDLANRDEVKSFTFSDHPNAKQVSIINNAGILGPVDFIGKIDPDQIQDVLQINFISSFLLMNSFIKKYQESSAIKVILNISSGAGRHPFESWGLYCSTKSALDMISQVAAEEQKLVYKEKAINVFTVAPGIVDTNMQEEIRAVSKEQFPKKDAFIGYFENKQLSSTNEVALKLIKIIDNPYQFKDVILDVRNI